jgi:hypothetical protein
LTLGEVVVVVCGVMLGRWIHRAVRRQGDRRRGAAMAPRGAGEWDGFAVKLGDVVVRRAERDEAWLASALLLSEQDVIAVLFLAPDAGGDHAVYARRGASQALTWLSPVQGEPHAPGAEPPYAIEQTGVRFERTRRLPVRVSSQGTPVPEVGDRALVAEYNGPGLSRLLMLAGDRSTLLWSGVELPAGEYDVLPGGATTRPAS